MAKCKAMIAGVAGTELSAEEFSFFREVSPWGAILFARNVESIEQLNELTGSLRDATGRSDLPILVDQEGGRVQRLRPPLAPNYPSARMIGDVYKRNAENGLRAAWLLGRLHAFDLLSVGINVNCMPILDVPVEGAHEVIGDRAYANDCDIVTLLGRQTAEGLIAGGVLPVIKHMPGHGRAFCDTHKELARVDVPLADLVAQDFVPFKALNDLPMAMTAHVVFEAIDPDYPATLSDTVIRTIIRDVIEFDGLVMSDDISMKALSGELGDLAEAIISAGCDIVLHCSGDIKEMYEVANRTKSLEGRARRRADLALSYVGDPDLSNEKDLREEFDRIFRVDV